MMKLRFIIILFILLQSPSQGQEEQFSSFDIDDLVSLYNSGEVDEFLSKAKDIRPAIRGPKWRQMVTNFTNKKLDTLLNVPIITLNLEEIIITETYANYGHQIKDVQLQNKKLELGLKFLTHSLAEIEKWELPQIQKLKSWWYKHWLTSNKAPLYAYRYAQLFDKYSPLSKFESVKLVSFFDHQEMIDKNINEFLKITYQSSLGSDLCGDNWVWDYLWKDIKNFVSKMKKNDSTQFDSKIVNEYSLKCWNSAKNRLFQNFHQMNAEDIHFTLHLLSLDRTLTYNQKVFIHIYYLLFEPTLSELYKNSLDILLGLSLSEKIRIEILQMLNALDPLPGKVFSNRKTISLEVLLRLSRSFPEYLDSYAQTCLDFLSGNKKFPKGNPTPNCLDFCRTYRTQDLTFFTKPVYKSIIKKYMGQCEKLSL